MLLSLFKPAYLSQGKGNVFLADWAEAAHTDYNSARQAVKKVGRYLAALLEKYVIM